MSLNLLNPNFNQSWPSSASSNLGIVRMCVSQVNGVGNCAASIACFIQPDHSPASGPNSSPASSPERRTFLFDSIFNRAFVEDFLGMTRPPRIHCPRETLCSHREAGLWSSRSGRPLCCSAEGKCNLATAPPLALPGYGHPERTSPRT